MIPLASKSCFSCFRVWRGAESKDLVFIGHPTNTMVSFCSFRPGQTLPTLTVIEAHPHPYPVLEALVRAPTMMEGLCGTTQ